MSDMYRCIDVSNPPNPTTSVLKFVGIDYLLLLLSPFSRQLFVNAIYIFTVSGRERERGREREGGALTPKVSPQRTYVRLRGTSRLTSKNVNIFLQCRREREREERERGQTRVTQRRSHDVIDVDIPFLCNI